MDIHTLNDKLVIDSIAKSYKESEVLNSISFTVKDGEFLSILGPSGCGKTTLLRILIGLLKPDSGTIKLNGEDITNNHPSKRHMGIVFQNYALFENMNVLKNVEYALLVHKIPKDEARKISLSMLEAVGLQDHIKKYPKQLSGGQQQRVAIARTLALKPEIILFDEPMSALDVSTRLAMRKELKDIQAKFHTTMIYVTHDQEEAFTMSDRILIIDKGNISQLDTPLNIIKKPANEYVKSFVIDNLKTKADSLAAFSKNIK